MCSCSGRTRTSASSAPTLRRWNLDVQWNTELVSLEQLTDHVRVTLTGPDGQARVGDGVVRRRLRRRPQRGPPDERHRVSRRAVRPRLLRRRHQGHRADGAGRAERLPVSRRLQPVLSHARGERLARHRHPAGGAAQPQGADLSTICSRGCARRPAGRCRFTSATGSRPTAFSTAAPRTSARGGASCSATRRTCTAPPVARA
jgi:hypothetical protein